MARSRNSVSRLFYLSPGPGWVIDLDELQNGKKAFLSEEELINELLKNNDEVV